MLAFGPDACLYAGIGDGGSEGDPNNNGQNLSSLLGKLLRLNPDTGGACSNGIINPFVLVGGAQQVWSLGLRNPWRFSFDRITGDLYIGDVGQGAREEINVAIAPNAGRQANYGWRLMEGSLCFNPLQQLQLRRPYVAGARLSAPQWGLFSDRRVCVSGIRQAGPSRHVFLCRFLRGICEEFPLSERSTHRANRMAVTQSAGRFCDELR